ncbi:MAG: EamA family transporter [Clostridia bacterium]|nr:EamA family transporter [Clostridia bacterium]
MKRLSFLKLISSMAIFGTIGIFVRFIDFGRGFIASSRGIIGALFLLALALILKKKPSLAAIKANLPILLISGAAIGINWILLFESYSYTTIAASTLCYYMAPVIVILLSPIFLKERLTAKKLICVTVAIVGALFVSGILESGFGTGGALGCILALGAAAFYASVIILNKKLKDISPYDTTVVQLLVAGIVVLPYAAFAEDNNLFEAEPIELLLILVVAIVHTGIAYALYFSSIRELKTETVAIFSYLDPVVAVLLSIALSEPMSPLMAVGSLLIIISLVAVELPFGKGKERNNDDVNY